MLAPEMILTQQHGPVTTISLSNDIVVMIICRGISKISSVKEHHLTRQLSFSSLPKWYVTVKRKLTTCFGERTIEGQQDLIQLGIAMRTSMGLLQFDNLKSCNLPELIYEASLQSSTNFTWLSTLCYLHKVDKPQQLLLLVITK